MKLTTVEIDLAKSVFQVHGVDEHGKAIVRKQLRRNQVLAFFARQERCLIGLEVCGSALLGTRVDGVGTCTDRRQQNPRGRVGQAVTR